MRDLHDAGLTLHIDDFGTGYSSLQVLHHFPVDAFKIDRSFIETLTTGDHTDELVRAIIAMGKALGLTVVAEGIETTGHSSSCARSAARTARASCLHPLSQPTTSASCSATRSAQIGTTPHEQHRPARRTRVRQR
jgi:EAL domain-containing protein (putative c-di-GMP-specific phosphodiesterase class I)